MLEQRGPGARFKVGHCGKRVWIADGHRVLDVGSGHVPFPRADTLLEKYPDQDAERSGVGIDRADPRLVIGDATAMPFADKEFDYVVASHIAEHVDDPAAFFAELSRVARAGYIETPGWLGDLVLREPFHPWRIRRRGSVLEFRWVKGDRGLGWVSDLMYAAVYLGLERSGHRIPVARGRIARAVSQAWRYGFAGILRLPIIVDAFYTRFEWHGTIPNRRAD